MSNQTNFLLRGSLKRTRKRTIFLEVCLSEQHLDSMFRKPFCGAVEPFETFPTVHQYLLSFKSRNLQHRAINKALQRTIL